MYVYNSDLSQFVGGNSYYGIAISVSPTGTEPGMTVQIDSAGRLVDLGTSFYSSCLQEFTMTALNTYWSTYLDACNNGPSAATQTYYHDGSALCLASADVVYMDSTKKETIADAISTPFKVWYQGSSCGAGSGQALEFNGSGGYVNGIGTC